jgi:hypothetical protein
MWRRPRRGLLAQWGRPVGPTPVGRIFAAGEDSGGLAIRGGVEASKRISTAETRRRGENKNQSQNRRAQRWQRRRRGSLGRWGLRSNRHLIGRIFAVGEDSGRLAIRGGVEASKRISTAETRREQKSKSKPEGTEVAEEAEGSAGAMGAAQERRTKKRPTSTAAVSASSPGWPQRRRRARRERRGDCIDTYGEVRGGDGDVFL